MESYTIFINVEKAFDKLNKLKSGIDTLSVKTLNFVNVKHEKSNTFATEGVR